MISLGLMSFAKSACIAIPAPIDSSCLSGLKAGLDALYGKLMPKASIALAIVLAVYIPPHAPAPGQAFSITCW